MPVKSKQQLKFMGMCAKNPETAKGDCPPKSVAQEFLDAPRPKKLPKKKKVAENIMDIQTNYPNLVALLEQYRVRKPSELAKLRQDARNERMARKKGKMTKRQKARSKARQGVLKADAEEDYIYSRDFRESLQSAIDSLLVESKKKSDAAYGSAETHDYHSADQADVQAMLDKHPSNPANKPKKKRKKAHYGKIKAPSGDALDIDYPSDSGRY